MEADAGRVPETALGAPSLSGGSKDVVVVISNKPLALTALVLASIVGAYAVERRLQHFAGTALGHAIGVLGATLLLVVFFYPVRKYFLRRGSITEWLAWHMVLGIVGPLLVLMHGAFHFHALLPLLASLAMVLNVLSGLVGRYLVADSRRALRALEQQLRDQGLPAQEREQELFARASSVRAMAQWRMVHYPLAAILLTLMVFHVVAALYFKGL
jgi:hypothetical protein